MTGWLHGSFRGVPFLIEQSSYEGGRRMTVHEFAARELPLSEDLGRRARRYDIECWVIGLDYRAQRDQLLTALETPGSGVLVHPYFGVLTVQVESVRIREVTDKGGMAAFSLTFHEAGVDEPITTVAADTVATTTQSATESLLGAAATAQIPPAEAQSQVNLLTTQAQTSLPSELAAPDSDTPAGQALWLSQVVDWLVSSHSDLAWWSQLMEWPQTWVQPAPLNGSVYQQTHARQAETTQLLTRLLLFIALLNRLITMEIEDPKTVATLKGLILAESQALLYWRSTVTGAGIPPTHARWVLECRRAVLVYLTEVLHTLPIYEALTLQTPLPAVVLSYMRYGSLDQVSDLLNRNQVSHPLFVHGTVEVLSV